MKANISNLHLGVLDNERQVVLNKLTSCFKHFILGGGTALAFQINHRKSFDFDFFSSNSVKKNLLEELSQSLQIENVSVDTQEELTFFTTNEIKVTFLHYPFKHLYPVLRYENELQAFSVKDIAVMKAYTIGRRGEYRDYYDLYCILIKKFVNLPELIADAKKIYGSIFDEKIFLQQLVYFKDLLNFKIIPVNNGASVADEKAVQEYLENAVMNYLKL